MTRAPLVIAVAMLALLAAFFLLSPSAQAGTGSGSAGVGGSSANINGKNVSPASVVATIVDAGTLNAQSVIAMQVDAGIVRAQSVIAMQVDAGLIRTLDIQLGTVDLSTTGFTGMPSSSMASGSSLTFSGNNSDSKLIACGSGSGDTCGQINSIGASAASSTRPAFRFDQDNGALGAGDAHTIWSDNNKGTTLGTLFNDGSLLMAAASKTKGSCTLNGGTPGTCTATVNSGAICICSDATAVLPAKCAVSGTTLTATGAAASTDVVTFLCL